MQHSLEKNICSAMVRVKRVNRQAEEKRNACQDDEQATASSISSTSSSEIPIRIPVITYSTDDEDQTSATTAGPAYFIVNTHPSHMPGEHWLALTLDENGEASFFDSYGSLRISSSTRQAS
ncbi:hypothetical protein AMECASPLE_038394 [Ameca splendens]|uniref:Uncharacterized protein n=1 Tax=Ameca splendens TaxID=208324 RepID=A0ABV0Z718_9TELE